MINDPVLGGGMQLLINQFHHTHEQESLRAMEEELVIVNNLLVCPLAPTIPTSGSNRHVPPSWWWWWW